MKTTLAILLAATATALAQLPAPDIRIIENHGQYDHPGIWGSPALTNATNGEVRFAVNDQFFIRTEPRANVSTNIVAPFSWSTEGPPVQRIMSIGVNIVNIGSKALHFNSAFNSPQNYYWWGGGWPGVKDLFILTLWDTNGVNIVHEFRIHATLTWFNRPAIPGAPFVSEFGPWWQGLPAGYASQTGLDPDTWNAVIDTSNVQDGPYRMTIKARDGNSTSRKVLIEALELKVIGF